MHRTYPDCPSSLSGGVGVLSATISAEVGFFLRLVARGFGGGASGFALRSLGGGRGRKARVPVSLGSAGGEPVPSVMEISVCELS